MKRRFTLITAAVMLLTMMAQPMKVWAQGPDLNSMVWGTPIVDENFNALTAAMVTTTHNPGINDYDAMGEFNCIYNNNAANSYGIEDNTTLSSKALKLQAGSGSPVITAISGKAYATKGAFSFKMTKASKCYVGLYNETISGTAYAKAKATAYLQNNEGVLSIGSGSAWVSVGTFTSTDVLEICVIYNSTNSAATYGNSVSLAAKSAHVYVNGACVMNGASPKAFTIPGIDALGFRVSPLATSGNVAIIDDLKIYDALPTASGGSGTATTTTINASGITNTNKYVSTEAGSLAATVTYGEPAVAVPAASVTWSGNNDAVATINASTGAVTLVNAGIVTFTASYAGDATYNSSSDTYVMTVTNENPALTTIWSEDFSGYSVDDVPSGGTYSYACTNGGGTTKIYANNNAGGTSPELLVAKTNGTFTATIPLLTSTYCYNGDLTLKYKTNANSLNVKTITEGLSVDTESPAGTGLTFSDAGEHTITFKGVTTLTESITIVFTATTGNNVRLDDIMLKGEQAALTKVSTPVISPASGSVISGTEVTITCLTDGASIYYTTDGSTPTSSSTAYNPSSKPTITTNTTLKAIGIKGGLTDSEVATVTYTIAEPCATPTFSVAAGEVDPGTTVTISTVTDGATIYYTTDGTDPTTSSSVYSSAITINTAMSLKAIAAKDGMANSAVASVAYTVRDYANLPLDYNDGSATLPTGFTPNGLGSDYSGDSKLKFDGTGDYLILKTNEAPASLSYTIKGNSFSGGTFKVQTSTNGVDYSDLAIYTSLAGSNQTYTHLNLASDVRYIKWIYTSKSAGNVGLGNFKVHTAFDVYGTASIEDLAPTNAKKCTIYNGGKLTVNGTLTNATAANLVIKNGGQLVSSNAVAATVEKSITGYNGGTGKWYLIASPVNSNLAAGSVANLVDGTYDLYQLDQSKTSEEWCNYKANTFTIDNQKGYLYANNADVTLEFVGSLKPSNANVTVDMAYTAGNRIAGYNLVGNPFPCNAYANKAYYAMNAAGNNFEAKTTNDAIAPCTGVVVCATGTGQLVTFSKTAPDASINNGSLQIALTQANEKGGVSTSTMTDNAIVSFNEGEELGKFVFNENNAKIYFTQDGKDLAIATRGDKSGMPLNFKATQDGTYTLSVEPKDVEMDYLHLVDKLTGNDIDLLTTPSYSFEANTGNNANRFRLVFAANDVDEYSENTSFAYFNGSEWVIENDGQASLQVIDVMGRMLRNEVISGNATTRTDNLSAGVYVMRLVNGEKVKTQKIVVEQ